MVRGSLPPKSTRPKQDMDKTMNIKKSREDEKSVASFAGSMSRTVNTDKQVVVP